MLQSCMILCDSTDYKLPGSSVHGILQARILEWIAIPFSKKKKKNIVMAPMEKDQLLGMTTRSPMIRITPISKISHLHS